MVSMSRACPWSHTCSILSACISTSHQRQYVGKKTKQHVRFHRKHKILISIYNSCIWWPRSSKLNTTGSVSAQCRVLDNIQMAIFTSACLYLSKTLAQWASNKQPRWIVVIISAETDFQDSLPTDSQGNSLSSHFKCTATLPCELWKFEITTLLSNPA